MFILLLITIIIFFVMRALPGDPILIYMSRDAFNTASEKQIAEVRQEFGLERPVVIQYFAWLGGVFRGDLGKSIVLRTMVADEIGKALPRSLYIGFIAFVLSIIFGVPLGVIAAIRRGKWTDTVATLLANLGITAPVFWIGIILILVFGLYLRWLPVQGYVAATDNFWASIRHIILPVICLTIYPMAAIARQARSAMLEVIRQDYIRTAWAKGLAERTVIFKHAARNCIIPVITLIGLNIRVIFGGQVLIETVFNIPGMGRLSVESLFNNDYAVVQGVILVIAIVVVFSNLLVDLSYGWVDPRIRYE
jgi:peptide/nickel transport system permease protein